MTPDEFQKRLDEQQQQNIDKQSEQAKLDAVKKSGDKVANAVNKTTKGLKNIKGKVKVTNPDLAKSGDVASAVEAINKLNLTTFMQNEGLPQLADNLSKLGDNVQSLQDKYANQGLKQLSDQLSKVVTQLRDVAQSLSKAKVEVSDGLQKTIDNLKQSIDGIDFSPEVNVNAPPAKVVTTPVDLNPVVRALEAVEKAVTSQEMPDNKVNLKPVTSGLKEVVDTINAIRFPVSNFELPFKNEAGKSSTVQLDSQGRVPIAGTLSGGGDGAILDGVDANIKATVKDLTNSNPVTTALVDANGDQIVSFGGGTQYTEDAAAAADPIGSAQILVRKDTPATTVSTDGDNIARRGTNYGAAYTQIVTSGGAYVDTFGGGTQYTEDAAAAANPVGNALIVVREDARAGSLTSTDGDNVALRGNNAGELYVKHTDSIAVTGTFYQTTQPVSIATNTPVGSIAHDAAGAAVNPLLVGGYASAAAPADVSADADAVRAWYLRNGAQATVLTAAGALIGGDATNGLDVDVTRLPALVTGSAVIGKVSIDQTTPGTTNLVALAANQSVNVAQINGVTPLMGAGNTGTGSPRVTIASDQAVIPVGGAVAHDGVDSGNPQKVGGIAKTAPTTAVSNADRTDAMFDIYGKQIVRESLREDLGQQQTQISSSTSETTIVTADGTYKLDIYALLIANTSATATKVTLKDSTTGTTRWVGYVPAGDMRGFTVSPSGALKQAAANNNWTLTAGTSVAALEITAMWTRSL